MFLSSLSLVVLEEEIWRLHEENDKKQETIQQLRERTKRLEEELWEREQEVNDLKKEQVSLEQKVQNLTGRIMKTFVGAMCRLRITSM